MAVAKETVAMAALSLGLTFVGTCHEDISQALLSALMEREQAALQADSMTRLLCVGVGLLYLGKQQEVEVALWDGRPPAAPNSKLTSLGPGVERRPAGDAAEHLEHLECSRRSTRSFSHTPNTKQITRQSRAG